MRGGKRDNAGRRRVFSLWEQLEVASEFNTQRLRAIERQLADNANYQELTKLREAYQELNIIRDKVLVTGECPLKNESVKDRLGAVIQQLRDMHHQDLGEEARSKLPEPPRFLPPIKITREQLIRAHAEALAATLLWCRSKWPERLKRTEGTRFVKRCLLVSRKIDS